MLPIIPAYTAPSTTNILNGQVINDTDIKALVESTNGVNARLAQLANNVRRSLSSTATLVANQDAQVYCDTTSAGFTITLPAASTQYKPIYIRKTDATYNALTIARAGTDTIDDPTSPALSPVATSLVLRSPGQDVILVPDGAIWRIEHISDPIVSYHATLSTGGVSATNTESKLYYNAEVYDRGSYYNNATTGTGGRFTPLIPGVYRIQASAYFAAGTSSELILILYKNTAPVDQISFTDTGNSIIKVIKDIPMNGTTDYIEVYMRSATTTKTILNLDYVTWVQGTWDRWL